MIGRTIVQKNTAWHLVRCVEGNLDLNSFFCSKNLYTLIGNQLGTTEETGLTRWKLHHS